MKKVWDDARGTAEIELYVSHGVVRNGLSDEPVPISPLDVPLAAFEGLQLAARSESSDTITLELEFSSSGYYDSGQLHGEPETCYPPESEEDRQLEAARLCVGDVRVSLPADSLAEVEDHFWDEINEAELAIDFDDCQLKLS